MRTVNDPRRRIRATRALDLGAGGGLGRVGGAEQIAAFGGVELRMSWVGPRPIDSAGVAMPPVDDGDG
jgi:hypothetical protein